MKRLFMIGIAVLAGCASAGDPDMDTDMTGAADWSAQLMSQSGSDVQGSAGVQSVWVEGFAGTTGAAITIGRADVGAQHPWHIHTGSCATGGPIFGDPAAYPVLRAGSDGNASATANLAVGLNPAEEYHVNVHRSPSDLGTIVACGNLDL